MMEKEKEPEKEKPSETTISSPYETVTYGGAQLDRSPKAVAKAIVVVVLALVASFVIFWGVLSITKCASSPLKVNGFFDTSCGFKNESTGQYPHTITGTVKNNKSSSLTNVTITVTYTISTSGVLTASVSGITIPGNGTYTFHYDGTSSYFGYPNIQTIKATINGKTYTLKWW